MDKVFTKLGGFGPIILYIAASYLLWKKNTSIFYVCHFKSRIKRHI